MRMVRVVSDPDGQSRFEDLEVAFADLRPGLGVSAIDGAVGTGFRRFAEGFASDFHPTALRERAVIVAGQAEYEVGTGDRRQLGPGDVIQLDDTHGVGHRSRNVGGGERIMLVVALGG
ncbi:MAG: hypothetical protein ABMB14_29790 [Myxococcota bacterium]